MRLTAILGIVLCLISVNINAQPGPLFDPVISLSELASLPYRPKDGDKLGYSKEESIRRLDPEVRSFLDGVLRLYKEPGVFTDRKEAFRALGTEPGKIRMLQPSLPRISEKLPFEQYAAQLGIFTRAGWNIEYIYWGPRNDKSWRLNLEIEVPSDSICIDSRAVEGYLDIYLRSGLDGYAHPKPPRLWNRHGTSGSPYGEKLFSDTPELRIGFVDGCLVRFSMVGLFKYDEVSDDKILN